MRALIQLLLVLALVLGGLVYADLIAVTPQGQALLDAGIVTVMNWVEGAGAALDEVVDPIPAGE